MNRYPAWHRVAIALQFIAAGGGGAWAGHAVDPAGWGMLIGMVGMCFGLLAAHALSSVLGLVFAPVVMAQILRKARATHEPPQGAIARHDVIGIAMVLVVVTVAFVSALMVALAVWLMAAHAPPAATLLRFLLVAALVAALAPAARRIVV